MVALIFKLVFLFDLFWPLLALGLDLESEDDDNRAILIADGSNSGINLSQILPLLALASAGLLPLLCICALSIVLLWYKYEDVGYGHKSSYSEYGRDLGLDLVDWDRLSIVDWISLGEETFRKFEPSNLSCQTRLVCEVHQNAHKFGPLAQAIVNAFSYLNYASLLNLPDGLQGLLSEYQDAADRGKSPKKDCGQMYPNCDFSIGDIYHRYLEDLFKQNDNHI